VALLCYVAFGNTILNDMVASVTKIAIGFFYQNHFAFTFSTEISQCYSVLVVLFVIFICFVILQNGISEYFFWNEFGRYNFIAVNYLIYTNEVIGNIMESYPVIPLFSALFALVDSLRISLSKIKNILKTFLLIQKIKISGIYLLLFWCCIAYFALFINERKLSILQMSYKPTAFINFILLFVHSELDYFKFYKTIPAQEAFSQLKQHSQYYRQ
jgi:hypothetical protein